MKLYRKSEIETIAAAPQTEGAGKRESATGKTGEAPFSVLARSLQSLLEALNAGDFSVSDAEKFRRVKQSGAYQPVAAALDALCDELSALLFVMRNCDKCDVLPKERH